MSAAEGQILATLLADAVVSGLVANRIYALVSPPGAPVPLITYQRISAIPINSLRGASGVVQARIQVDCWAATYEQAKDLAQAVRAALDANAELGAVCLNSQDMQDEATREFRVIIDFSVWSKE